jgi:hypothetical protein
MEGVRTVNYGLENLSLSTEQAGEVLYLRASQIYSVTILLTVHGNVVLRWFWVVPRLLDVHLIFIWRSPLKINTLIFMIFREDFGSKLFGSLLLVKGSHQDGG